MPRAEVLLIQVNTAMIVLTVVESVVIWFLRRARFDWRAAMASGFDFFFRRYVVQAHLHLGLVVPASIWVWDHRLTTIPLDTVWSIVLLFLSQEFCLYWHHRLEHHVRWLWAHHAIHHTSNQFTFAAAYRTGWTAELTFSMFFYLPAVWIGFPLSAVIFAMSANMTYQVLTHSDWIPKLGWLEYVLNTPSHHRVHHAVNPEYINANYGGLLIVYDRLFGTFKPERDDLPCRYGLIEPLYSNNPFVFALHEWAAMARDLWRARSWGERLRYFLGTPGAYPPAAPAEALEPAAAPRPAR